MKVPFVFAVVMLALAVAPLHAAERYGARTPVRLSITSLASNNVVRCQVILAHFATLADYRLAPGATRELVLQREVSSGALVVPRDDGRLMAVENIYCGFDERWSETRGGLDLNDLRDPSRDRFDVVCVDSGLPVCRESD